MGLLSNFFDLFAGNKQANQRKATPGFEEQLETFKQLGFTLNEGVNVSEILEDLNSYDSSKQPPYYLLYITLGQDISEAPWTPFTNQCWNFDTEAIEDHGCYVEIIMNISRITNGELIVEKVEDYVDLEEEKAWVSFSCRGDHYKWDLNVDNDWVDGCLFDNMQALTTKYKTKGKFTYFDTGGQDFVLGFHTPEQLEKIRNTTGLEIVWLKTEGQIY